MVQITTVPARIAALQQSDLIMSEGALKGFTVVK